MSRDYKNCTICNIYVESNYCGRCGQRITTKTSTTISLITEFFTNFFSLEKSVFATIFKVVTTPKTIVNNYFHGYRNYFASPGKVLLLGIATVALHVSFVDEKIMGLSMNVKNLNAQYLFWLILFPLFLLISYLTFFRIEKNTAKHIISTIYISATWFIFLTVLNDIIILTFGDRIGIWAFILFVLFVFIWNSIVFTKNSKVLYIILNTIIQLAIFCAIIYILILKSNSLNG